MYYNITSSTEPFTVEVTYQKRWSEDNYKGLTSVTIPATVIYNGATYNVTAIGDYAFYGCTGLTSITFPNSVTSIGENAFNGCRGLTSVTIPENVISIGDRVFAYCTALTSIIVESGNTIYDSRENCNAIIEIATNALIQGCNTTIIPNSVTSIGNYAFLRCTSLTSITIPSSVTSVGINAFYGCTGLTSVTIPNSVTSIGGGAFADCTALTSITIPESVTSIGSYAFYGCTGLTSITIPESVTSIGSYAFNSTAWYRNQPYGVIYINKVLYKYKGTMPQGTSIAIKEGTISISGYAFSDCTGLTSITIPESVTSLGNNAFYGCYGLTSVTIPENVTSIGGGAFSNCAALTSITIPENVTSIGDCTFSFCIGLTSITIPESVTSIGSNAFAYCTALTSITIPESVTSIGSEAFCGCCGLTSVTIPENVTSIGRNAFLSCTGLTSIHVEAQTPPQCSSQSFYNVSSDIPVYISCGTKEAYQAAAIWSSFTNYIETPSYSLTVTVQNETMGSVRITQQATCSDNTAVFEATANNGYLFSQWSDGNTDNPRTIVVNEDITLTAQFVSTPTAIDNTSTDTDTSTTHKVLRNRQVYILHNGKTYTLVGVEVK